MHTDLLINLAPLVIVFLVLIPAWAMIFHKAGYSGWLSLLFIIPLVNIILFLWFAFFAKWPVRERAKAAELNTFN